MSVFSVGYQTGWKFISLTNLHVIKTKDININTNNIFIKCSFIIYSNNEVHLCGYLKTEPDIKLQVCIYSIHEVNYNNITNTYDYVITTKPHGDLYLVNDKSII